MASAAMMMRTEVPTVTQAPKRVRDRTSRPTLSVPRRCSPPGGCRVAMRFVAVPASSGWGAMMGARTAASATRTTMPSPTVSPGCRPMNRSPATAAVRAAPPARAHRSRGSRTGRSRSTTRLASQVGECHDDRGAGDGRGVQGGDGVGHVGAQAGPVEEVLDQEGVAQRVAEDEGQGRHDRAHGRAQGEAPDDGPLREADGAGHAHVLLAQRLQQPGPREPRDETDGIGSHHERRQQQVGEGGQKERAVEGQDGIDADEARDRMTADHVTEVAVEAAGDRQPVKLRGEDELEEQPEPEDGQGDEDGREAAAEPVGRATLASAPPGPPAGCPPRWR